MPALGRGSGSPGWLVSDPIRRDAKDTQSFSARAQETGLRESGPDVPSWAKGVRARVALLEPPTAHLAT